MFHFEVHFDAFVHEAYIVSVQFHAIVVLNRCEATHINGNTNEKRWIKL